MNSFLGHGEAEATPGELPCRVMGQDTNKRSEQARKAANIRWEKSTDRAADTTPARDAWRQKFFDEVDAEAKEQSVELTAEDREQAVAARISEYMHRLADKSAKARQRDKTVDS